MINSQLNIPNHIAIIPDGNRRWAKDRGEKPWKGHEEGANRIEELVRAALELKVKNITFWGSSVDNLKKRPLQETRALLSIYENYFEKLINSQEIFDNQARINIVGLWKEQFPGKLKSILKSGIEKTKEHSGCFLNFLLAYGGKEDVIHSVKEIAKKVLETGEANISEVDLENNLLSSELPEVDLIIRTGVESDPHNSAGFLMWQTQNSQIYYSKKRFPDFSKEDFIRAIEDFSSRQRRKGA